MYFSDRLNCFATMLTKSSIDQLSGISAMYRPSCPTFLKRKVTFLISYSFIKFTIREGASSFTPFTNIQPMSNLNLLATFLSALSFFVAQGISSIAVYQSSLSTPFMLM